MRFRTELDGISSNGEVTFDRKSKTSPGRGWVEFVVCPCPLLKIKYFQISIQFGGCTKVEIMEQSLFSEGTLLQDAGMTRTTNSVLDIVQSDKRTWMAMFL